MITRLSIVASVVVFGGCAASSSNGDNGNTLGNDAGSDVAAAVDEGIPLPDADDDGGFVADATAMEGGPPAGDSKIYASTNTELWSMDPMTKAVTQIGAFDFGSGTAENITDVAVDKNDVVYVTSETTIYIAKLPASGSGPVTLTKKLSWPTGSKFYALGLAPEGVLEAGEGLVGGDSFGDLYYLPSTGGATQKLGSFGDWAPGDPKGGKTGDVWELSGDVVFFSVGGTPRGLATLRPCVPKGACTNGNDVVAEIDMTELAKKSPTANLRKAFLGAGTGYAKLFGIGAWEDAVYAFSNLTKGTSPIPAQLVSVDATGKTTLVQSFPAITDGWTGAGITTKAKVSVIK